MNKLQYRSSEAPTPWGLTNVPEEPDGNSEKYYTLSEMGFFFDKSRFDSDVVSYNEALELALKNWIPIRVEDQEKVKKITWNWLCENEDGAKLIYDLSGETKICNHITWKPESKLYHIPEGMEFELDWNCDQLKINSVKCTIDCRCEVAGLKPCKQFYALKSKAEEKTYCQCDFAMIRRDQKTQIAYCFECKKEIKEVEEKPKEETLSDKISEILDGDLQGNWKFSCLEKQPCYCQGNCEEFSKLKKQIIDLVQDTKETESLAKAWDEGMAAMWNELQKHPYSSSVPNPKNPYR